MQHKAHFLLSSLSLCSTLYTMEQNIISPQPQAYAIQYAPWRETYLAKVFSKPPTAKNSDQDIFCHLHEATHADAQKYILYRGAYCYVMLNAHPYVNEGHHLLIIPYHHEKHYNNLSQDTRIEMDAITQYVCESFSHNAYEIHSNFNIGTNALASIPSHIHQHIIVLQTPRVYTIIEAMENTASPIDNATQYTQLLPLFKDTPTPTYTETSHAHKDNTCYYCTILQQKNDKKNLIIARSELSTVLFDHQPFCAGDIIIIPNDHHTNRTHMTHAGITDMLSLLTKIYPFLLTLFNAQDLNMGMISYGERSTTPQHIRYQIAPRPGITPVSPITKTNYLHYDIEKAYKILVEQMNAQ